MNKPLLILCLGVALVGCDGMKEEAIGPLSGPETTTIRQFSDSIETALLSIEGNELFERGNAKLNKAVSDWLVDCQYTTDYDSRGRKSGRTVSGVNCPFAADWQELIQGPNTESVSVSYLLRNDNFGDNLPMRRISIRGTRQSEIENHEIITKTTYRGTTVDIVGNEGKFTAVRRELASIKGLSVKELGYTYDITIQIDDQTFKGRSTTDGYVFVNGVKINSDEFQTLFFVLK